MHNMFVVFDKNSIELFSKFKEIGVDISAYTYFYADIRHKTKPEMLTKYPAISCDKSLLTMLALALPAVTLYKIIEVVSIDDIFADGEVAQISKIVIKK